MFIAIEGVDGTGKATQTKLLRGYLEAEGIEVATFSFPRYGELSAALVEHYLQGRLGTESEIGPYAASMYYQLDRFHAAAELREALDQDKFVICDRYVGSNMAHHGQKINDLKERVKYFKWCVNQEFGLLNIPRPDMSLVLSLPAETAQLFASREDKSGNGSDIHDQDINHLRRASETYKEICTLFPEDFIEINCAPNKKILSVEDVHNLIIKDIKL